MIKIFNKEFIKELFLEVLKFYCGFLALAIIVKLFGFKGNYDAEFFIIGFIFSSIFSSTFVILKNIGDKNHPPKKKT